jgi:hypothetical protein
MRLSQILVCGVLATSLTACKKTSGTGAAKEDMQLVPKESQIVLMANVTRMRDTAMWKKVLDLRDSDEKNKAEYQDFVQKCNFDPFKQLDSVFLAMPQQGGGEGGTREFAGILRGTFDEDKLVACAREQAKKDGGDVVTSEYNGKKLYTDSKQGQAFATFLDKKVVAVGGKEWIKKVVDLSSKKEGESAKQNEELNSLMKRAKTSDALWGAGIVPQSTRDSLKADPQLSSAATMKNVFGSVDFANGFAADINVDTASENDAKELAAKVTGQIMETRKSPQFMMMGLASFLDGVKVEQKGATFHTTITLTQQQVDDLISRVKGLLKSFGSALGGGSPSPGLPPTPPTPTP